MVFPTTIAKAGNELLTIYLVAPEKAAMNTHSIAWTVTIWALMGFVVVGLGILLVIKGFSYTVDDFPKYVLHLHGSSPDSFVFRMDREKVREDFLAYYDLLIIKSAFRENFEMEYDPKVGDKVVDKFRHLKMLGAWAEGNDLVIANPFLRAEEPDGVTSLNEFAESIRKYSDRDSKLKMSTLQKGLFSAMRMFERVEIRGLSKDDIVVIPMR